MSENESGSSVPLTPLSAVTFDPWLTLVEQRLEDSTAYLSLLQDRAARKWVDRTLSLATTVGISYFRQGDRVLSRVEDLHRWKKFAQDPLWQDADWLARMTVVKDVSRLKRNLQAVAHSLAEASPAVADQLLKTPIGITMDSLVDGGASPVPSATGTVITVHEGLFYAGSFFDPFMEVQRMLRQLRKQERRFDCDENFQEQCEACCDSAWILAGLFEGPSTYDSIFRILSQSDSITRAELERVLLGDEASRLMAESYLAAFVVAHEIGHVALGHTAALRSALLSGEGASFWERRDERWNDEFAADAFAVQVLAKRVNGFRTHGWAILSNIFSLFAMWEVNISAVPGFRNRLTNEHLRRMLKQFGGVTATTFSPYDWEHDALRHVSGTHPSALLRFFCSIGPWCGVGREHAQGMTDDLANLINLVVGCGSRRHA